MRYLQVRTRCELWTSTCSHLSTVIQILRRICRLCQPKTNTASIFLSPPLCEVSTTTTLDVFPHVQAVMCLSCDFVDRAGVVSGVQIWRVAHHQHRPHVPGLQEWVTHFIYAQTQVVRVSQVLLFIPDTVFAHQWKPHKKKLENMTFIPAVTTSWWTK